MNSNVAQAQHPGETLYREFMEPAGLSATALAKALGITPARINDIVRQRRGITGDTALRLARYFGGDALDWLVRQARYDLSVAEKAAGKAIEREIAPRAAPGRSGSNRTVR